jgi:hypothetical protein
MIDDGNSLTVQVMMICMEESESRMLNSWYPNEQVLGQHIEVEDGE